MQIVSVAYSSAGNGWSAETVFSLGPRHRLRITTEYDSAFHGTVSSAEVFCRNGKGEWAHRVSAPDLGFGHGDFARTLARRHGPQLSLEALRQAHRSALMGVRQEDILEHYQTYWHAPGFPDAVAFA